MEVKAEDLKSANKINYREKNLDYLEKIKEKKQRQIEDKILVQKKQQQRKQNLKKKILQEAVRAREAKIKNIDDSREEPKQRTTNTFESLPKIPADKQKEVEDQGQKRNYQQRYLTFLQSLTQNNKSKKEIQQAQRKRKQEKVLKLKQQLGYTNVECRIGKLDLKKEKSEMGSSENDSQLVRSHSAQKFESLIQIAQNQLPKTNNNFRKKNQQYLEKIKKKRIEEEQLKQEQRKKKQKLKEKLKDYVLVTVKKNVQQGYYEQQDKKPKRNKDNPDQDQEEASEDSDQDRDTKRKRRKVRSYPNISDLAEWKKKNRLENGDKVFIITGGYKQLKLALQQRGWVRNPDCHSPCFDFKFTLQGRQIQYSKLLDFQIVNHFEKNGVITTKLGLTKSLRNSIWINDCSEDNFYPKCFDLNDDDDYVGFQTHFKVCKALSILKIYADSAKNRKDERIKKEKNLLEDLKLRTEVALAVCEKNIQDLDDIIDKKKMPKIITDKEWEILASDQLNQEGLAKKKHEEWLKSIDYKFGGVGGVLPNKTQKQKKKKKKHKPQGQQINTNNENEQQDAEDQLLEKVEEMLEEYKQKYPQFHLTGHNNIWILKPAGLSRGRGITCYNNFVEIQDHIRCKQSLWIAQKYIQNPLVVLKRKFDIRQWVLVTDFNPLIIWMYNECYIRFSAIDYDPKQVSNKFIHLTNNSIGAYYKDYDKSPIKGNMFFEQQFKDYLIETQKYDVFEEKIRPQMKDIIRQSLLSSLDGIQNRKNTHELFGYDFMIDENFKVWLIEVNSSPSMDYSTHVTTKLVKQVLPDLVKVVVDRAFAPKKEKKNVDTGKFKRIYKGIQISQKVVNAGLNLCLEGVPINMKKLKKNPTSVKPNQNMQLK